MILMVYGHVPFLGARSETDIPNMKSGRGAA